jgi:hypothetical protein
VDLKIRNRWRKSAAQKWFGAGAGKQRRRFAYKGGCHPRQYFRSAHSTAVAPDVSEMVSCNYYFFSKFRLYNFTQLSRYIYISKFPRDQHNGNSLASMVKCAHFFSKPLFIKKLGYVRKLCIFNIKVTLKGFSNPAVLHCLIAIQTIGK